MDSAWEFLQYDYIIFDVFFTNYLKKETSILGRWKL